MQYFHYFPSRSQNIPIPKIFHRYSQCPFWINGILEYIRSFANADRYILARPRDEFNYTRTQASHQQSHQTDKSN